MHIPCDHSLRSTYEVLLPPKSYLVLEKYVLGLLENVCLGECRRNTILILQVFEVIERAMQVLH